MTIPRTALVTGAGRRIGRAIAGDLAAAGWSVLLHCRNSRMEAEDLRDRIAAAGGKAAVAAADFAEPDAPERLMHEAIAALGPIGLLVNSASTFEADEIGQLDPATFERQMRINLTAPVMLTDAFARQLPAGAEGLVVNLVDQRVLKPTPRHVSYMLSKSALFTATRTLAQGLAPRIRVNAIGPGPTLPNDAQSPDDFRRQTEAVLLRRGPALAEFARTILFMVDTPSLTGQMICIDGGQHLAWQTPDVMDVGEG